MELVGNIFGWTLLTLMVAFFAWLWTLFVQRQLRKSTAAEADQPRYAIVETIEPGMRVVQDRENAT